MLNCGMHLCDCIVDGVLCFWCCSVCLYIGIYFCVFCGCCFVCGMVCGVCGVLCVVCGVWCVVCGVWCVVCGEWCVVCGVWCEASGEWRVERDVWLGVYVVR